MTGVCAHLLHVPEPSGYIEHLVGRGVDCELLCRACADNDHRESLEPATDEVIARVRSLGRLAITGAPEVIERPDELAFVHESRVVPDCPDLVDVRPDRSADLDRWIGVTADGRIVSLDLDRCTTRELARVPGDVVDLTRPLELHVSHDARFAAVVNVRGARGAIVELASGSVTLRLTRDGYHEEHCNFPFAFVTRGDRQLAIHAPDWNWLDVVDVRTGESVTKRERPDPTGAIRGAHDLNYFHAGLHVSPGQRMIADNGWIWQPYGVVETWSLERWLADNVWESEDGPTRATASWGDDWDIPLCWLDDTRLALRGYGDGDASIGDAVQIIDTLERRVDRWFAGPKPGELVFDRVLFVLGAAELTVWDVERGARIARDPTATARYHPTAKRFITLPRNGHVTVSRMCGLDAAAPWCNAKVRDLAAAIASDRHIDVGARDRDVGTGLRVLGDALEDAGCTDAELLAHCRSPGTHVSHCWVLDRLLLSAPP